MAAKKLADDEAARKKQGNICLPYTSNKINTAIIELEAKKLADQQKQQELDAKKKGAFYNQQVLCF